MIIAGGEPARIGSSAVGRPAKSAREGGTRAASGLLRSTADGGGCSTCAAVCRGADDGGGADGGRVGGHWYDIGAVRSPMVRTPAELGRDAKDCGVRRGLSELQHDETGTGIGRRVASSTDFSAETVLKHDVCSMFARKMLENPRMPVTHG